MAKNIFPSAGRKYDQRISRVASENSLFTTQKIDLYASMYGMLTSNHVHNNVTPTMVSKEK